MALKAVPKVIGAGAGQVIVGVAGELGGVVEEASPPPQPIVISAITELNAVS